MFWHNFKYNLLITLRDRQQIFWSMIFTMILGTLFCVTFNDAYEKSETIKSIDVAVYIADEHVNENFQNILDGMNADEDNKLLDVTYTDNLEDARQLLLDGEVKGVFYSEDSLLKLIVKDTGVEQSILEIVASEYKEYMSVATNVAKDNPQNMDIAIQTLGEDSSKYNTEVRLTDGDFDPFRQYFYNLIAMSCMFACFSGMSFAVKSQGNLSAIGARKCVSDCRRFSSAISGLLAIVMVLFATTLLAMGYLTIIGVDFGNKIPQILLIVFVGTIMGTAFGYFIGNIGRLSAMVKEALCTGISLASCFFSGLMIGNMRAFVENVCPVFNKINPATVLSDAFYSLEIYDTYDRYIKNIVTMLILTVIFIVTGVLFGRRKKYASI